MANLYQCDSRTDNGKNLQEWLNELTSIQESRVAHPKAMFAN